ncbi:RNA polymerase II transcription factor B subunit 1 [Modicella reniformis]|uniref:RNA polymerase II transcription factor B subunit 1 n=1 Tax=Modicella reniformis TaxID=1440133 RepID=A0A9P6INE7_9FUNG|nr:RNA polymerase II transcription factor B subunit 1 [Modicella reniformis]
MIKVVEIKPDTSHGFVFTSPNATRERNDFKERISAILAERQLRANAGGIGTPGAAVSSPVGSPSVSDVSAPGTPRPFSQSKTGTIRRGLNGTGPSTDLKVRFELLKQNKELAMLHKELVMGKHVSEEEFWESRKHLLRNKTAIDQQQKGQSSAWLDLKPQTGESNDVKYIMTPQVIHSVCQQYPSRRSANEPDDDIFDRALEEDEEETKSAPKRIKLDHINRLVDLSTTEEDHIESYTSPDSTMAAGKTKESKEAMPLIRRFNRYAQRVLNSTVGPKKPSTEPESFNMNGVERAIVMEDLQQKKEASKVMLDIQDTRRYYESQGGDVKSSKIAADENPADILQQLYKDFSTHDVELNKPFAISAGTFNTLMENVKSNRAKMMPPKDGSQILPASLYQEALSCHAAGNEILRHFWASTTPDKTAKHVRMIESLKKIRDENIASLMNQAKPLGAECWHAMEMMLKPMQTGIQKALKRAETLRPKPLVKKLG